jgi:hypothetical protein
MTEQHTGPPPNRFPFQFTRVGKLVMNGNLRVCEAISPSMALRIANALNSYKPVRRESGTSRGT